MMGTKITLFIDVLNNYLKEGRWRISVSKQHRSLALEDVNDQVIETKLELYIPARHLSRYASNENEPKVFKVMGSVTVSF